MVKKIRKLCQAFDMHFQALVTVLTFGSAALGAQLTQVSNYGGNAKAKPGM
jgi:acetylxylan esterase